MAGAEVDLAAEDLGAVVAVVLEEALAVVAILAAVARVGVGR